MTNPKRSFRIMLMSNYLTVDDIDESVKDKVYTQDYASKSLIEGVKIISLKDYTGEDSDFTEIIKINEQGYIEALPEFKIMQINRSYMYKNSVKAWHLHFKQDELWYVAPTFSIFVGLWDVRKNSPTKDQTMRVVLGGKSQLLFIPRGVAHGAANFSNEPINIYYFVNQMFNINEPDERRIPWKALGQEFWTPIRD